MQTVVVENSVWKCELLQPSVGECLLVRFPDCYHTKQQQHVRTHRKTSDWVCSTQSLANTALARVAAALLLFLSAQEHLESACIY